MPKNPKRKALHSDIKKKKHKIHSNDIQRKQNFQGRLKTSCVSVESSASKTIFPNNGKLSELQLKFRKKLDGARFRTINEELYTTNGEESFKKFQENPSLYESYHEGFREQVRAWPENPLDVIIDWVKLNHGKSVIADMGCGDGRLAASVPNKVYSFDLIAHNDQIVACDIAKVPLENSTVDLVVFCLSLMGTNLSDFLREAYRILKPQGTLKIAEVRSRFEGEVDGMKTFLRALKLSGFDVKTKEFPNKMFFLVECKKSNRDVVFENNFSAKPCLYKKR